MGNKQIALEESRPSSASRLSAAGLSPRPSISPRQSLSSPSLNEYDKIKVLYAKAEARLKARLPDDAMQCYKDAHEIQIIAYEDTENPDIARTIAGIGDSYFMKKDFLNALDQYQKVQSICDLQKNVDGVKPDEKHEILNNLACCHHAYAMSLFKHNVDRNLHLTKSLDYFNKLLALSSASRTNVLVNKGVLLISLKRFSESEEVLRSALSLFDEGNEGTFHRSRILRCIGTCERRHRSQVASSSVIQIQLCWKRYRRRIKTAKSITAGGDSSNQCDDIIHIDNCQPENENNQLIKSNSSSNTSQSNNMTHVKEQMKSSTPASDPPTPLEEITEKQDTSHQIETYPKMNKEMSVEEVKEVSLIKNQMIPMEASRESEGLQLMSEESPAPCGDGLPDNDSQLLQEISIPKECRTQSNSSLVINEPSKPRKVSALISRFEEKPDPPKPESIIIVEKVVPTTCCLIVDVIVEERDTLTGLGRLQELLFHDDSVACFLIEKNEWRARQLFFTEFENELVAICAQQTLAACKLKATDLHTRWFFDVEEVFRNNIKEEHFINFGATVVQQLLSQHNCLSSGYLLDVEDTVDVFSFSSKILFENESELRRAILHEQLNTQILISSEYFCNEMRVMCLVDINGCDYKLTLEHALCNIILSEYKERADFELTYWKLREHTCCTNLDQLADLLQSSCWVRYWTFYNIGRVTENVSVRETRARIKLKTEISSETEITFSEESLQICTQFQNQLLTINTSMINLLCDVVDLSNDECIERDLITNKGQVDNVVGAGDLFIDCFTELSAQLCGESDAFVKKLCIKSSETYQRSLLFEIYFQDLELFTVSMCESTRRKIVLEWRYQLALAYKELTFLLSESPARSVVAEQQKSFFCSIENDFEIILSIIKEDEQLAQQRELQHERERSLIKKLENTRRNDEISRLKWMSRHRKKFEQSKQTAARLLQTTNQILRQRTANSM